MRAPTVALPPDAVEQLHRLAWPLVPLCRPEPGGRCSAPWHGACADPGKRPLMPYCDGLPSWETVARFLRERPCNVALLTGTIVAVEADSDEADDELAALVGGSVTVTRERRAGSGRAYLYKAPVGATVPNAAKAGAGRAIDVRGRGGLLVLPPSLHSSGVVRTWVTGRSPFEVDVAPLPLAVMDLVRERDAVVSSSTPPPVRPRRMEFLLATQPALRRLWRGQKKGGDTSRSGIDFAVAVELLRLGVTPAEVAGAVKLRLGAHRADDEYARRTTAAALAAIRRTPCR